MNDSAIDVLIVGGGPVGLALSIDLSWRGIRHRLIDQAPKAARVEHPRMDQVGIRSMEHFRRVGIVAQIEAAGFPRDLPRDIVFETSVLGYELAREPVTCDRDRTPPSFSPQKHELCPQNFFDAALQAVAERAAPADIRYDTRLVGLREDGDGVHCTLVEEEGSPTSMFARYVVGCDGASSIVAQLLGIRAASRSTLACSTNIFIDAPVLAERTAKRQAYRHILLDTGGVWGSMVNIDGQDLWRLQVLGDAERPDWDEVQARTIVDRAIGEPVPYHLKAVVPWMRRELVVDRFSRGRCFLAGDAAHQFSPTGGYGMNTGLSEAFDLSWKLAATLAGWGGERLLQSYDLERRPVAIRNARQATANFQMMRRTPGDPAVLDDTPEGAMARARIGREVRETMKDEWDSMGIHLGYSYAGSPLILDDDEDVASTGSNHARYEPSAAPGARAPHAWLRPGLSTLDLFGRGFTLLVFDSGLDTGPLAAAAQQRAVPLQIVSIDDPAIARLYAGALVLVRPDGHVAWRADDLAVEPGRLFDRVRGALQPELRRGEFAAAATLQETR